MREPASQQGQGKSDLTDYQVQLSEPYTRLSHNRIKKISRFYKRLQIRIVNYSYLHEVEAVWLSLQTETNIPSVAAYNDDAFIGAFRYLERIISQAKVYYYVRMAYVRLHSVFQLLDERIAADRHNGTIARRVGYGNSSIAVNLYLHALPETTRYRALDRRRIARRWFCLMILSPISVALYPCSADTIV